MKVLLISNQHPDSAGVGNPIMYRMRDALSQDGRVEKVTFLPFYNKISSLFTVRSSAKNYDIVHVHFGGLYALIIWIFLLGVKARKLITFHGTDIHAKALASTKSLKGRIKIRINQQSSFCCIRLFDACGFVAKEMMNYLPKSYMKKYGNKLFVQPLGVNYKVFGLTDKNEAKQHLGLKNETHYVLFSDISGTSIKRRDLAESIVARLGGEYQLLIMCGVTPEKVPYFINSCDCLLLTSDEEGSPNIVREALSLNKPVFSFPVGDVAQQLDGLKNSCIISYNLDAAAEKILLTMRTPYVDNTREMLKSQLDFFSINSKVIDRYIKLYSNQI